MINQKVGRRYNQCHILARPAIHFQELGVFYILQCFLHFCPRPLADGENQKSTSVLKICLHRSYAGVNASEPDSAAKLKQVQNR